MGGKVTLVGAGPGDIGLITVRGRSALESADVVVYDALVGQGVLSLIPEKARRINVGKRASHHLMPQDDINKLLLAQAQEGNDVVRLKGGDPFLFGRGGEELELLRENNIPFEVIPGVTSALSVPAYAGIPVTHRSFASSLHIITGHAKAGHSACIDYEALVKTGGTFVFLMGITALPCIMEGLLAGGISPKMPAAVLERGTTAHQRRVVSTVEGLARDATESGIKTPAIIVVGEVCALAEQFHWAEDRPLGGVKAVVTRPRESASGLASRLRGLGAEVLELPVIKTVPISPNTALAAAMNSTAAYEWLVLTSPAGVRIFFEQLLNSGTDIRALAGLKIAAVGAATAAELAAHGVLAQLTPKTYNGAALGAELAEKASGRVLILRAKNGGEGLTKALAAAGVSYDDIALYNTVYSAEQDEALRVQVMEGEIDYVLFTSASTVKGFFAACGELPEGAALTALCIGGQTAAEAEKHGIRVVISPKATIESMAETLIELNRNKL